MRIQPLKNWLVNEKIILRNKALKNILSNSQKSLKDLSRKSLTLEQIYSNSVTPFMTKCDEDLFNLSVAGFRKKDS